MFMSSNGEKFALELAEQVRATDKTLAELREFMDTASISPDTLELQYYTELREYLGAYTYFVHPEAPVCIYRQFVYMSKCV